MIIDCRDCDPEWCAKHEPVTREVRCPGGLRHPMTYLAETWGWCQEERSPREFNIWELPVPEGSGPLRVFPTYQSLSDWFVANVINQEVTA